MSLSSTAFHSARADSPTTLPEVGAINGLNSDQPAPAFPPELERHIFEICALSRPVFIPTLMLVAWRIKEWVEPLLYRTIALDLTAPMDGFPVFTSEKLLSVIARKPASFFRDTVRNLLLLTHAYIDVLKVVLPVCTGVQNLCVESLDPEMIALFAPFPLNRLYIEQDPFGALPPVHPLFSHLTHFEMEMVYWPDDTPMWTALALLPLLTHLSFSADDDSFIPISHRLLETCKTLSVLVILINPFQSVQDPTSSRDFRVVAMPLVYYAKDWQKGAQSGKDYWSRAESFIEQRRSGKIDASQYRILEDESKNIPPVNSDD
ncbi:hypothetical protein FB451DRAFT_1269148 [Mycena latifolia]|nr:hypothetical protein FB451DRAFT_1269148 [Mycena latifolia]